MTYGLGSVSENLPAYCVMPQPEGVPEGGAPCWAAAFLPAVYQGTLFRTGPNPILNLKPPADVEPPSSNRRTFDLVQQAERAADLDPATPNSRPASPATNWPSGCSSTPRRRSIWRRRRRRPRKAYGLDDAKTADFGTRLLARPAAGRARRALRAGLLRRRPARHAVGRPRRHQRQPREDVRPRRSADRGAAQGPEAARAARRTRWWSGAASSAARRISQGGKGRDHNPLGYTMWLAGGGVEGRAGRRRDRRVRPERGRSIAISVNDFHATILHLLGLDHEKLTFRHSGRDERLTDVAGQVVEAAVAWSDVHRSRRSR